MPASFWSEVDTADGTKGRVTDESNSELAVDWIGFDNSAETGPHPGQVVRSARLQRHAEDPHLPA